jgi:hypothetical protein
MCLRAIWSGFPENLRLYRPSKRLHIHCDDNETGRLAAERAPLISTTEEGDAAVMHGDRIAALTTQLEEEKQKAELRLQIAAAQSDGDATPGAESESASVASSMQRQSPALPFHAHHSAEPDPEPDPSPAPFAVVRATEHEPVAEPATTDGATAAAKVQALWRGKGGGRRRPRSSSKPCKLAVRASWPPSAPSARCRC